MNKKMIIIGIMLIFVTGCFKGPISTTTGIINEAKEQAKIRTSELAYTGVQYAISSYLYDNYGNYPSSIKDIESYFNTKLDNLEIIDGKIIEKDSGEELCEVTKITEGFKIDCKYLDEPKIIK